MIHLINIIIYIALIVINYLVYDFFHSYLNFIIFILLAIFPFVSIYMVFLLRNKINIQVSSFEKELIRGESGIISIDIINPTIATTLFLKLNIEIKNKFIQVAGNKIIEVPTYIMGTNTIKIPIISSYCGIVSFEVKDIVIRDLGGFISIKKKINKEIETYVFPDTQNIEEIEQQNLSDMAMEADESSKRGSDFADVCNVREYLPGDRLMNIHWKLTAKKDILMVKERVSMSDSQIVILVELCKGIKHSYLDDVISMAFGVCSFLLQGNDVIKLMWFNNKLFEFEEKRIETKQDLREAIRNIYFGTPYEENDLAKKLVARVRTEIKSFVYISNEKEEASITVVDI